MKDYIATGALVPLLDKWCGTFPGFYVCYEPQKKHAPCVRVFLDFILDRY
ncbi:hypothetical protein [Marinomonas transparens]